MTILSTNAFAELSPEAPPALPPANEISALIAAKEHPYLDQKDFSSRAEDLQILYKSVNDQPLWLGRSDSATSINQIFELFSHASEEGLNPNSYGIEKLKTMLPSALQLTSADRNKQALFDTALSLSLLRYLHDIHYGRVNPHGINFNLKLRDKKLADLPGLIILHRNKNRIAELPVAVEPNLDQYRKLKQALKRYRDLAAGTAPLKLQISKTIRRGEKFAQAGTLRKFLTEIGEITPEDATTNKTSDNIYDKVLSEGVKNFQIHHGLAPDGVLGKGTAVALNIPLTDRVTQIELAMERLRWLPDFGSGAYVIVNIPAFKLWVFDDISKPESDILNMRVVVGKAMKTQTPVLMAEMRFIDFAPFWNVPYSITKNEIVPKLLTNPGFLNSQNMEIVAAFSDHAKPVALTGESLLRLKQGLLKVRQRPGKKNPLGRVKFMFPNKDDVYLHDTQSKSLFSRSTRDFSHGCVRVEKPLELAKFALRNQPEWSEEKIKQAMQSPKMKRVMLKSSIPVLFFYTTVSVESDGGIAFYNDIYGHDPVLIEALKNPSDVSDQLLISTNNDLS